MSEEHEGPVEQWRRPTGQGAIAAGYTFLVISIMAALVWGLTEPNSYSDYLNAEKLRTIYWAGLVASISAGLSATSLSVGYIVRALYFLPGDDKKRAR